MKGLLGVIKNAITIAELRKKILITIALVIIYRIGCHVPVPGLSAEAVAKVASNGMFGFMDLLSGGALKNASVFAMGISPYINASIIMQLLTIAIPTLEKIQKEGEEGRKKIAKITRYATIGLAIFQSVMLYINLQKGGSIKNILTANGSFDIMSLIVIVLSFTAGTAALMWLGEKITEVGIGNGISMLIFAGIVSNAPNAASYLYNIIATDDVLKIAVYFKILVVIVILIVFLAVIAAVVWMEGAERKVPVQYAKKVVGRKVYGGQNSFVPLKVNSSGVLPIIFAISLLQFPPTIVTFINSSSQWATKMQEFTTSWLYLVIYAILIVAFTFFYNMVYFDPIDVANNLKKNGGFVPGLRPGRPTADYIRNVSRRITWFGAFFLAILAIFPSVFQKIAGIFSSDMGNLNLWFGGTSVLILVGVALETVRQIEAQMLMRHYKGFLE